MGASCFIMSRLVIVIATRYSANGALLTLSLVIPPVAVKRLFQSHTGIILRLGIVLTSLVRVKPRVHLLLAAWSLTEAINRVVPHWRLISCHVRYDSSNTWITASAPVHWVEPVSSILYIEVSLVVRVYSPATPRRVTTICV